MAYGYRDVKCPWCGHYFTWNQKGDSEAFTQEYRLKETLEPLEEVKCPKCEMEMVVQDHILIGMDPEDERVLHNYDFEEAVPEDECPFIDEEPAPLTPSQIVSVLDRTIVGQDKAKKILAVAVYNHQKRLRDDTGRIKKSNILLVGPSGSGKTLLAKTLAKVLNVPFTMADATAFSEVGYVGEDVESILTSLLDAADGDMERAQQGIVFIDEIDKIARKSGGSGPSRDVSGEGVQHALLKIIEDTDVTIPLYSHKIRRNSECGKMNTRNILFICGGAFEGLRELEGDKVLGFNGVFSDDENDANKDILPDAFVNYGMTPELMGRLPVIVQLNELTEDDLVRILTEPEDAITREYQDLLAVEGVNLIFEKEALEEVAKIALERNTGARGLRSVMEDLMLDIMFYAPDRSKKEYIITKDTVLSQRR